MVEEMLDQRLADQVFPRAQAKGVGVLVRSDLLQGALTARADHLPPKVEALKERSRAYRELVAQSGLGLTPAQMAIAFALADERVGCALLGMRTESELDDAELLNPGTWYRA